MTRMFLTYFFFTESQTKAWLGQVAEPAAVKSLQLPGPGPRPIPMPCWPQETCKARLQMPLYGRGRERQRCPPRGQSHDLGLFLANHWLPSQRPCRQKAQASTGPACHFLTLSEDPRTRRGYKQRERTEGAPTSNKEVSGIYIPQFAQAPSQTPGCLGSPGCGPVD